MQLEAYKSILYSDTLVPDIFISEYLPSMESDFVKVYLHCLFLYKYSKRINQDEIARKLEISSDRVKECFAWLEGAELVVRKDNYFILNDLKEKQIRKMFKPRETSDPEDAVKSSEIHRQRSQIITSINNKFYSGLMAPSLYTDIDAWFNRYGFDEEVMYMLFAYCSKNNALTPNYIQKVAEAWHGRNIRTSFELEAYFAEYQKFKDVRGKIIKKLKLGRNLTEYEDSIVEKWLTAYKYDFDLIELALRKTVSKTNPNFRYIDRIISEWHAKGVRTAAEAAAEIEAFERSYSEGREAAGGWASAGGAVPVGGAAAGGDAALSAGKASQGEGITAVRTGAASARRSAAGGSAASGRSGNVPQKNNYNQRQYDDAYYDSLYYNVRKRKEPAKSEEGSDADLPDNIPENNAK